MKRPRRCWFRAMPGKLVIPPLRTLPGPGRNHIRATEESGWLGPAPYDQALRKRAAAGDIEIVFVDPNAAAAPTPTTVAPASALAPSPNMALAAEKIATTATKPTKETP